jgi:hypothetical protein
MYSHAVMMSHGSPHHTPLGHPHHHGGPGGPGGVPMQDTETDPRWVQLPGSQNSLILSWFPLLEHPRKFQLQLPRN